MQISTNTYPAVRTPVSPTPRRDEAWAEEVSVVAQIMSPARPIPAASGLPDDMLQARLRGRLLETNASFASQQALAQYADVARRDESRAQVEVLGIDAYV